MQESVFRIGVVGGSPPTTSSILEGVRGVGAKAAARASEIEDARIFPQDLWEELEDTQVFRALLPEEFGGPGLPLSCVIEAVIEGARANGTLGWLLMVGTPACLAVGAYPKEQIAALLRESPHLRSRGVFAPKGKAVRCEGGYRVSGQWPFASGGPDPDYFIGNCIVHEDGRPVMGPDGPVMVFARMYAGECTPIDTWHVLGMRGTDSRDYAADDVFVPDERCHLFLTAENNLDTPEARMPIRVVLAAVHCAVAVGIAWGALDEIGELAKTKRPAMSPQSTVAEDPVFRHGFGESWLRFTSCKAMLDQATADMLRQLEAGQELSSTEILLGRTMSAFITAECVRIVDWTYTAAGGSSVYNGSSLQQRFRDIHVATQHVACHTDTYRTLAASLLGEALPPSQVY